MTSLQNKCLNIVLENFDEYYSTYTNAKSSMDKQKFEFLQRKYSFLFAEKLYNECSFRQEHMDFVINKFLKSLNTVWLEKCEWAIVCKKFSEIGPSLERVHFDVGHPWEEVICHLCNLEYAIFDDCNDLCLDSIAKFCPKIKSIEFGLENISSAGLKLLCCQADGAYACPELREIIIHDCDASKEKDILYLFQKFPMLENFDCRLLPKVLYSIHKDDMQTLNCVKPYNLTKLSLKDLYVSCSDLSDILKICVKVCPNVKSLACCVDEAVQLNLCSEFNQLQELRLKSRRVRYLDINNFLVLKGNMLTSLDIFNVSFLTTTLLTNLSRLKVLKMDCVNLHYHQNDNSPVPVKYNLKELYINDLNMSELSCIKEVAFYLSCLHLEQLKINGEVRGNILCNPEIRAAILRCCEAGTLEHIKLNWSDHSFQFVRDILLTCTSLKTLDLNSEFYDCEIREPLDRLKVIAKTLPNKPIINFYKTLTQLKADVTIDCLDSMIATYAAAYQETT